MANPPTNVPAAANATPSPTPGTGPSDAPISDTTFTLRELLTAALQGPARDISTMFFTPTANQAPNAALAALLSSACRARVDPEYRDRRARFVGEALKIQMEAAPGQGVEDAYVRMEGTLGAAKRLEEGMEAMLVELRREKLRPAAGLTEREGREVDVEVAHLVGVPMDLRGMKEALLEKGCVGEGEEGGETAEAEEDWGKEEGGVRDEMCKTPKKGKGKKGQGKAAAS